MLASNVFSNHPYASLMTALRIACTTSIASREWFKSSPPLTNFFAAGICSSFKFLDQLKYTILFQSRLYNLQPRYCTNRHDLQKCLGAGSNCNLLGCRTSQLQKVVTGDTVPSAEPKPVTYDLTWSFSHVIL